MLDPAESTDGSIISSKWVSITRLLHLHDEYGLFVFLAAAFRICRDEGFPLPEDLLRKLDGHFDALLSAGSQKDGLAALGFGTGPKGRGPWQGISASVLFDADNVIELVDQVVGLGLTKSQAYGWVAAAVGRKPAAVKLLYLKGPRRQRKR